MNITSLLAKGVARVLDFFRFPASFSIPLISGMFEMTLGARLSSL